MSEGFVEELESLAAMDEDLALPDGHRLDRDNELKWRGIDQHVEGKLAGSRVLVLGSQASDDALAFAARGASYVLACMPSPLAEEESKSDVAEKPAVDCRQLSWEELDPAQHGAFEVVYCDLLHRVAEPLTMLRKLRSMAAPAATLLIGSMILADPERSEYVRFIPDRYAGDPTWWFVPGRLAFRWLVQTAGFDVESEFGEREGPRDLFPVVSGYLRAIARH